MKLYLDSSSFAKRFIEEQGSSRVETLCTGASALGLSVICVPEIISALNRRRRERRLSALQYSEAKQSLLNEVRDAEIIHLTSTVVATSVRILEHHAIRAMDALHIACALEWGAERFASADARQLRAARRTGLKTVNT